MPRNVAVERPQAGVGRVELHHDVPVGLHLLHVAALRIARVGYGAVPRETGPGGEHPHVVTVQVNRVRGGAVVADDHAHAGVGSQIADVGEGVEGHIACIRLQKGRVVVIHARRLAVEVPKGVARRVGEEGDVVRVSVRRVGDRHGEGGLGQTQCVVGAGARVGNVPRRRGGRLARVSLVVVDSGNGVGLVGSRARGDVGSHPECRGRSTSIGSDKDVGALSYTEGHDLGGVGSHGDKIIGNHRQVVAVNGEALHTLGAGVDQAKSMRLARGELELGDASVGRAWSGVAGSNGGAVEVHLTVDKVVVRSGRSFSARSKDLLHEVEVLGVVPVGQHHGTKIDVIVRVLGPVDDNGPKHAVRVLSRVVRVIPGSTVQLSLELISVALARGNGTLVDTGNTILPRRPSLQETVPVKRSALLGTSDVVVQSDLDGITPVGLDGGSGVSPIDEQCLLLIAIRGNSATADGEVICPDDTSVGRRGVGVRVSGGRSSPGIPSRKGVVCQESR